MKNILVKWHIHLPQVGYITQLLKPPINYVIIAVVIGIMVVKQFDKKEE